MGVDPDIEFVAKAMRKIRNELADDAISAKEAMIKLLDLLLEDADD